MTEGRGIALPPPGWEPPSVIDESGLRVTISNEDGAGSRVFDLSEMPGSERLRRDLAKAIAVLNGPNGSWRRVASFTGVEGRLATLLKFADRRGVTSFSRLTPAVWNDYRLALDNEYASRSVLTILQSVCPVIRKIPTLPAATAKATYRRRPPVVDREQETYSPADFAAIQRAAQGAVHAAYRRITANTDLMARRGDPDLDAASAAKAEALFELSTTGRLVTAKSFRDLGAELIRYERRRPDLTAARAQLFLTPAESLACAVLLICHEGYNVSVVEQMTVPNRAATAADDWDAWTTETDKPRRGANGRFATDLLVDDGSDSSPGRAMRWIRAATDPARNYFLATGVSEDRLILFWTKRDKQPSRGFTYFRGAADSWWPQDVSPVCQLAMLHRTFVTQISRQPVHHSRKTHLDRYLLLDKKTREQMAPLIEDGLRRGLMEARERLKIQLVDSDTDPDKDTPVASCGDFEHHPKTGLRCRESFLMCLLCTNASAAPRHVKRLVVLHDALDNLRSVCDADLWAEHFAPYYLSLMAFLENDLTPAAIEQARAQATDADRAEIDALLQGGYDY